MLSQLFLNCKLEFAKHDLGEPQCSIVVWGVSSLGGGGAFLLQLSEKFFRRMNGKWKRFVRGLLSVEYVLPFARFGLFYVVIPKICCNGMFNGMAHPCNLVLQKRKA